MGRSEREIYIEPLNQGKSKRVRRVEDAKRGEGEMEKGYSSEIRLAVEELSVTQDEEMKVSTVVFLSLSNLVLHVLDKIGPTVAVLRQDMQRNIERVEELYVSDPSIYQSLQEILKKEASEGTARKALSCSKAVLWLTRAMDFSVALLEKLENDSNASLVQVVEEAYRSTLQPWHGWISSAAYKVALKLIPERQIFICLLLGQGQDHNSLQGEVKNLVSLITPFLAEIHALLSKFSLDRLKST